jgi:hypothetical protein
MDSRTRKRVQAELHRLLDGTAAPRRFGLRLVWVNPRPPERRR